MPNVRRGEVWQVDFGLAAKVRPALVSEIRSQFSLTRAASNRRRGKGAHSYQSTLLTALALLSPLTAGYGSDSAVEHTARLDATALHVVIADNEAYGPHHAAGYNGVAELRSGSGNARNLFVPDYAGLNLEHIFSGDAESFGWHIFEPRRSPMRLVRPSPIRVELRQERTEHWSLRSRLVYEVKGDVIDFTYTGTPLADQWKKHGYIGVFFASYINAPEDLSIQFIGRSRPGQGDDHARWIKHLPEKHGVAASHRPAGSTWDPPMDEGFNLGLVKGTSSFEYLYPFYFGRSGENVFILMFERPRAGGELRFAQSPSGGGNGNPAWDFVYFCRDYAVNREFSFRVRAVCRKFTSAEDAARLYEKWSGSKVALP
jgi:hypothetical protein